MLMQYFFRFLLTALFALVSAMTAYPQMPILLRSTLGIGAASRTITSEGKRVTVPQSIGQSSVIGIFRNGAFQCNQGFIQPVKNTGTLKKVEKLQAEIYPNPFTNSITISCNEVSGGRLCVSLHNMEGVEVFSDEFPSSAKINLTPGAIPSGLYILKFVVNHQQYTCKVVKK